MKLFNIEKLILENRENLEEIFRKENVVLAYLFGSALKGNITPLSDVDIAVLFSKSIKKEEYLDKILKLASEIDKILGIYNTEVVCLNNASLLLKHRAVFYGKAIFVYDPKLKRDFELRVLQEYEDFKYYLEKSFEIMRRQIKEGTFGKPLISIYSKYLEKKDDHR